MDTKGSLSVYPCRVSIIHQSSSSLNIINHINTYFYVQVFKLGGYTNQHFKLIKRSSTKEINKKAQIPKRWTAKRKHFERLLCSLCQLYVFFIYIFCSLPLYIFIIFLCYSSLNQEQIRQCHRYKIQYQFVVKHYVLVDYIFKHLINFQSNCPFLLVGSRYQIAVTSN